MLARNFTPNRHCLRTVALLGIAAALLPVHGARAQTPYSVCAEPTLGGASLYWKADTTDPAKRILAGFRFDITDILFKRIGHTVVFRGDLPWSRCMRLVAEGEIDFAVGAYHDPERAKIYAFSKPFQTLTPQVFLRTFSSIQIHTVDELKKHKGCGMNGSSYAHYGLAPGELEQGAVNYAGLIQKLKAGRCDYFVEELEVIHGIENGRYRSDSEMRNNAVAGANAPTRHFVTRLNSRGQKLLPALNDALEAMRRTGEIERLWKLHDGPRP